MDDAAPGEIADAVAAVAERAGVTAHVVAAALGHESPVTTHKHYTTREAVAQATQARVLQVISGGLAG